MNPEHFDFWQDHSRRFLEMAFCTDRHQRPEAPDARARKTGDCGDSIEMHLTVHRDRITAVSFIVEGCLHTNACANSVARLAEGRTTAQAWEIEVQDVVDDLQTLPPDHVHCAELAVGVFYLTLSDYQQTRRQPWKKVYRTG